MLKYHAISEKGPVREENQDAILLPEGLLPEGHQEEGLLPEAPSSDRQPPGGSQSRSSPGWLFALADGIGGYAHGAAASRTALHALLDTCCHHSNHSFPKTLQQAVHAANQAVCSEAARLGAQRIGTTLTAAWLDGTRLHLAHIGDSRVYRIRSTGTIACLTHDHTIAGELLRMRVIEPGQVRTHARRSVLTRAVGLELFVQPEVFSIDLLPGDRLILCSDGVWSVVEDDEFAQVDADPASLCRALIDLALARGSDDNVSVIIIDYAIMTTNMVQIGDQFDRFQIQGHIAHGGMSDIYRAYDVVNRREVALKIPDQTMIGDPAQYERFQREKEVLQTLQHPAVLRGLGCGQFNRIPYLAMDLIEGQSLRDWITARAPLPSEEAVPLMVKIAEGVAYLHQNGVIHRDLKPENIILNSAGQPVIMDFGLALTRGAHRVTYSNLSATMGTPEYMAPEQVEGKRGDERSDIYALGVMLYEMLASQPPFAGDNPLAVMAQHVQRPAPRLDHARPGLDPRLAAVAARALQRSPDERFETAGEFIQALEHPETADLSVLEASSAPAPRWPQRWWQSIYLKGVALGFGILALLVVIAIVLQSIKR